MVSEIGPADGHGEGDFRQERPEHFYLIDVVKAAQAGPG